MNFGNRVADIGADTLGSIAARLEMCDPFGDGSRIADRFRLGNASDQA